jgi:endonuclease I
MITLICSFAMLLVSVKSSKGDTQTYYENIDPTATNQAMKDQLKALINPHTVLSYDDVWSAFPSVDKTLPTYPCDPNNSSYIPDVYSSYCWKPYSESVGGQECGNYKQEGDCFNREHIWPKSWYGGFDEGMNAQTDLFELWPSDGYVNGRRGNLPLGIVDRSQTISYTSTNGAVIGSCLNCPECGQCFEIADVLKGDVARSYFYLSVAYMNEWACCEEVGTDKSSIKLWMEDMLRDWHNNDPVDSNEVLRNDEIFNNWQHNRNPFIDYPEWVSQIADF